MPSPMKIWRGCAAVRCGGFLTVGHRAGCVPLQADLPLAALPREEPVVFDWAGETARRVGILVHAELQSLDLDRHDEATVRSRQGHFKRWLALHGVPDEHLERAVASVTAALLGVHRDARAQWMFKTGYRDDVREHALSGLWRGEVVRAVFDRSFIDEQGTRWVIDYKTSEHSGGGREQFLDLQVERYRPQLERYARAGAPARSGTGACSVILSLDACVAGMGTAGVTRRVRHD